MEGAAVPSPHIVSLIRAVPLMRRIRIFSLGDCPAAGFDPDVVDALAALPRESPTTLCEVVVGAMDQDLYLRLAGAVCGLRHAVAPTRAQVDALREKLRFRLPEDVIRRIAAVPIEQGVWRVEWDALARCRGVIGVRAIAGGAPDHLGYEDE